MTPLLEGDSNRNSLAVQDIKVEDLDKAISFDSKGKKIRESIAKYTGNGSVIVETEQEDDDEENSTKNS